MDRLTAAERPRQTHPIEASYLPTILLTVASVALASCEFSLGAERVGLVEELVDLLVVGLAQGVDVDPVLHDLLAPW